jgi:hypothetical protein
MALIDGDEFLFAPDGGSLQPVMGQYHYQKISSAGVWWVCYGSNGHIKEPKGLIIENYQMRPELTHPNNRHFKCIVRGHLGEAVSVSTNAHTFRTLYGTVDENLRPLQGSYMPETEPSRQRLRINHYVCRSFEYFKTFKQHSGMADAGAQAVRSDEIWHRDNLNEVHDDAALCHLQAVKVLLQLF